MCVPSASEETEVEKLVPLPVIVYVAVEASGFVQCSVALVKGSLEESVIVALVLVCKAALDGVGETNVIIAGGTKCARGS